jgi:hypothetical protein
MGQGGDREPRKGLAGGKGKKNKKSQETENSLATFSQIRPARSTSATHSPSLKKSQELKSASLPIGARARIMFQLICPLTSSAAVP